MNDDNDPTRRTVELCYRTNKTIVNPIIDWTDSDTWEFIKAEGIPYCSLYDEGWKRIGCIGCPLASIEDRKRDFARWPYMKRLYLHTFADMLEARKAAGKVDAIWTDANAVMRWWMVYMRKEDRPIEGQVGFADILTGG